MPIGFLDCEFSDLVEPQLLSLGLVTLAGEEHYCKLDMNSEVGRARRKGCSEFVKYSGVLEQFGRVPDATATPWELGCRTGEWLLKVAEDSGQRVEVAFDYGVDFELLEYAVRDAGLSDRVREIVVPIDIGALTGSPEGEIAAEECFRVLRRRGLTRHHALADAIALRAAYIAVKAVALRRVTRNGH